MMRSVSDLLKMCNCVLLTKLQVVEDSTCRRALINTATQCARDLSFWSSRSSSSGSNSSDLFDGGFWGGSSESGLVDGGLLNGGFFGGATGFLNFERPIQDSECCQASKTWVEGQCHCRYGPLDRLASHLIVRGTNYTVQPKLACMLP
eukprot:1154938-Pelagomonas_calceolata.AAC.4